MTDKLDFTRTMNLKERTYAKIMSSKTTEEYLHQLSNFRCTRCDLSKRNNRGIVIYKGNPCAQIMLIGEAPGKVEDKQGKAFVGPAGKLQDKIFEATGISTEKDLYLGNVTKCRPTAKPCTQKQNDTPQKNNISYCKPYILKEIELINPKIIIAVGKTAAITLYGFEPKTLMQHIVGRFFNSDIKELQNKELFVMYHPAAILHATGTREVQLKTDIWEQVKKIKAKIDELGIQLATKNK